MSTASEGTRDHAAVWAVQETEKRIQDNPDTFEQTRRLNDNQREDLALAAAIRIWGESWWRRRGYDVTPYAEQPPVS